MNTDTNILKTIEYFKTPIEERDETIRKEMEEIAIKYLINIIEIKKLVKQYNK